MTTDGKFAGNRWSAGWEGLVRSGSQLFKR
jgi:hypothetical protein